VPQSVALSFSDRTNETLYHGKELTDAHGLDWYHYGARFYDVARAQWTTMDPADEFHTPYTYVGGDPVNLTDPDGRASCDIKLCGQNGSSVTIKTRAIKKEVDVPYDFGGNYELEGQDLVLAGLNLVGMFDPSPATDALAASIYYSNGEFGDAVISGFGVAPYFGDIPKLARASRHYRTVSRAIRELGDSRAMKVASEAATGYDVYDCVQCANAVEIALTSKGMPVTIIKIYIDKNYPLYSIKKQHDYIN